MKVNAVETFKIIQEKLHNSKDLKSRVVQFFGTELKICYIAEITDNELLTNGLIYPICSYVSQKNKDVYSTLKNMLNKYSILYQHIISNKNNHKI